MTKRKHLRPAHRVSMQYKDGEELKADNYIFFKKGSKSMTEMKSSKSSPGSQVMNGMHYMHESMLAL